jgi:hypothetical protein
MPHGGRALTVVGWVLGWTALLAVGLGQAAERYSIVPHKSQLQFKGYSLLAKPLGTFHRFSGEIVANAQQLNASHVRFVIEAASLDTANAKRDQHLRSKDFLFVDQYPTITFTSTPDDYFYVHGSHQRWPEIYGAGRSGDAWCNQTHNYSCGYRTAARRDRRAGGHLAQSQRLWRAVQCLF